MNNPSRRSFIKQSVAGGMGLSASALGLNLLALSNAAAATSGPYKALVCVFLEGGNDGFNTFIPMGQGFSAPYRAARNITSQSTQDPAALVSLALDQDNEFLAKAVDDPTYDDPATGKKLLLFGLHLALPNLLQMYSTGKAAVVANVGPLEQATDFTSYSTRTAFVPSNLFSHSDQQQTWQSYTAANSPTVGFGEGLASGAAMFSGGNNVDLRSVFVGDTNCFSGPSGKVTALSLARSSTGATRIGAPDGGDALFGCPGLRASLLALIKGDATGPSTNLLEQAYTQQAAHALSAHDVIISTLQGISVSPPPVDNVLALDLGLVARMIKAKASSGSGRQVFFVRLAGFDTHSAQLDTQKKLLGILDTALQYFITELETAGLSNQVTTFTASDFGRKLVQNDNGTDHGWGNHHFVIGGGVIGKKVYGQVPRYELGKGQMLQDGVMIPTTSLRGYLGPLAEWFGVSATISDDIFGTYRGSFDLSRASNRPLMKAG